MRQTIHNANKPRAWVAVPGFFVSNSFQIQKKSLSHFLSHIASGSGRRYNMKYKVYEPAANGLQLPRLRKQTGDE